VRTDPRRCLSAVPVVVVVVVVVAPVVGDDVERLMTIGWQASATTGEQALETAAVGSSADWTSAPVAFSVVSVAVAIVYETEPRAAFELDHPASSLTWETLARSRAALVARQ